MLRLAPKPQPTPAAWPDQDKVPYTARAMAGRPREARIPNAIAKSVYYTLADHANPQTGTWTLSRKLIAEEAGCSVRAVVKWLKVLEEYGWNCGDPSAWPEVLQLHRSSPGEKGGAGGIPIGGARRGAARQGRGGRARQGFQSEGTVEKHHMTHREPWRLTAYDRQFLLATGISATEYRVIRLPLRLALAAHRDRPPGGAWRLTARDRRVLADRRISPC